MGPSVSKKYVCYVMLCLSDWRRPLSRPSAQEVEPCYVQILSVRLTTDRESQGLLLPVPRSRKKGGILSFHEEVYDAIEWLKNESETETELCGSRAFQTHISDIAAPVRFFLRPIARSATRPLKSSFWFRLTGWTKIIRITEQNNI